MGGIGDRRGIGGIERLGQTEIEHLDEPVGADLDVGRFQVAVDDAAVVRRFERLGDLAGDVERLVERQGAHIDPQGQRRPIDQLHDQRRRVGGILQPDDVGDVRVIQRGQDPRFATESGETFAVPGDIGAQHLDGDIALQLAVAGAVDLAHAAGAEGRENRVRAEARARRKCHSRLD